METQRDDLHSGMTGVLPWRATNSGWHRMAANSSQGTGKEGELLECLCPLGSVSTLECSKPGMVRLSVFCAITKKKLVKKVFLERMGQGDEVVELLFM